MNDEERINEVTERKIRTPITGSRTRRVTFSKSKPSTQWTAATKMHGHLNQMSCRQTRQTIRPPQIELHIH